MTTVAITRKHSLALWRCLPKLDWWQTGQLVTRHEVEGVCEEATTQQVKNWLRHMCKGGFAEVAFTKETPFGPMYVYRRTEQKHEFRDEAPEPAAPRKLSSPKQRRVLLALYKPGERISTGLPLVDLWGPHTVPSWPVRSTIEYAPGWVNE
jgi:hypothetical protein